MTLVLITYMAFLSRVKGGMWPHLGDIPTVVLYSFPFALVAHPNSFGMVISAVFAMIGKSTGHGRGISLGEPMKQGSKPEKLEWPILWLKPYMSVWGYKSLILAMCEAMVWIGIAMTVSPWLALGAICRPLAYNIGWAVWRHAVKHGLLRRTKVNDHSEAYISYLPNFMGQPTQIGELLTGVFNGAILAVLI